MKRLIEGLLYWGQLLLLPIYGLSFFFPRNKNIWVFGSTFGRRFADNPRYFYLYVNQNVKGEVRPIWISKKREIIEHLNQNGYEAYLNTSMKGIWYSLRAGVYIYDNYTKDISFALSGWAKKINTWHGVPLKKIQADNGFDLIRNPKNLFMKWKSIPRRMSDERPGHYIVSTSEFMNPIFASAFRTNKILKCGYPRNDILYEMEEEDMDLQVPIVDLLSMEEENDLRWIQSFLENDHQMIYYVPTFRKSEEMLLDIIDFERLKDFLEKNKLILCIKLHPKSILRNCQGLFKGKNVRQIYPDSDIQKFMNVSDMLITDYSSAYFDYLHVDRPIIFFQYDLKEYLANSREMYFTYEEFTPGPKVSTMEELLDTILKIKEGKDGFHVKRMAIRNKVFDHADQNSCERLYKAIRKIQ